MDDPLARADDFAKKAKFSVGSEAQELFDKAATFYKLAKSWDRAGEMYVKVASCYMERKLEVLAADTFVKAAHIYKKSNITESISCFQRSVSMCLEIAMVTKAALCYQEIAELYEQEQNLEKAIAFYEKAADLFQIEDKNYYADECSQKIAHCASQLKQTDTHGEDIAEICEEDVDGQSLNNNLLKYEVETEGICHLCKRDVVAIQNALERDEKLDPTFSGTCEYRLLVADAGKTTILSRVEQAAQDAGKTTILSRVEQAAQDAGKTTIISRVEQAAQDAYKTTLLSRDWQAIASCFPLQVVLILFLFHLSYLIQRYMENRYPFEG